MSAKFQKFRKVGLELDEGKILADFRLLLAIFDKIVGVEIFLAIYYRLSF